MSLQRLVARAQRKERLRVEARQNGVNIPTRAGKASGGNLVQIGGQYFDAQNVPASNGNLVRVQNVGRPAKAVFAAEERGSGVVVSGGGKVSGPITIPPHDLETHSGTLGWTRLTPGVPQTLGPAVPNTIRYSSLLHLEEKQHNMLTDRGRDDAHTQYALADRLIKHDDSITASNPDGTTEGGDPNFPDLGGNLSLAVNIAALSGLYVKTDGLSLLRPQPIAATPDWTDPTEVVITAAGHTHQVAAFDHTTTSNAPIADRVVGELMKSTPNGGFSFATDLGGGLLNVNPQNNAVWMGAGAPDGLDMVRMTAIDVGQRTLTLRQLLGQEQDLLRWEDSTGSPYIRVLPDGRMRSAGTYGFVDGQKGWEIKPNGNAEFNNVTVRGSLYASVFVVDEVNAVGGELLIATSSKLVEDLNIGTITDPFLVHYRGINATPLNTDELMTNWWATHQDPLTITQLVDRGQAVTPADGYHAWVHVEDPSTGPFQIFHLNDRLRIQTYSDSGPVIINSVWLQVVDPPAGSPSSPNREGITPENPAGTHFSYYCQIMSGFTGVIPSGAAVVRYGLPGTGLIKLKSDKERDPSGDFTDSADPWDRPYTPYIDVFSTGVKQPDGSYDEPWNGNDVHVRMGKLWGLGISGLSATDSPEEYGMATSTDAFGGNVGAQLLVASNKRLQLNNINLRMFSGGLETVRLEAGTGRLRLGTNITNTATTFFDVHPAAPSPYLWVGQPDVSGAEGMKWQNNELTIKGKFTAYSLENSTGGDLLQEISNATALNLKLSLGVAWVTGEMYPTARTSIRSDSSFTVKLLDGTQKTINAGAVAVPTAAGTYYLVVDKSATSSAPRVVATPGTNDIAYGLVVQRASGSPVVTMLPGRTVIDGNSILTGTVTAKQIAANTITSTQIAAQTITVGNLDPGAVGIVPYNGGTAYAINALVSYQGRVYSAKSAVPAGTTPPNDTYWTDVGASDGSRVLGVSGDVDLSGAANLRVLRFHSVVVHLKDGTTRPIGIVDNTGTHTYINSFIWRENLAYFEERFMYIDGNVKTPQPPKYSRDMTPKAGVDAIYFGWVRRDRDVPASATFAASAAYVVNLFGHGTTIIDGDKILTNSIWATKIRTDTLETIAGKAGWLEIAGELNDPLHDGRGGIYSTNKVDRANPYQLPFANNRAGFLLMYDQQGWFGSGAANPTGTQVSSIRNRVWFELSDNQGGVSKNYFRFQTAPAAGSPHLQMRTENGTAEFIDTDFHMHQTTDAKWLLKFSTTRSGKQALLKFKYGQYSWHEISDTNGNWLIKTATDTHATLNSDFMSEGRVGNLIDWNLRGSKAQVDVERVDARQVVGQDFHVWRNLNFDKSLNITVGGTPASGIAGDLVVDPSNLYGTYVEVGQRGLAYAGGANSHGDNTAERAENKLRYYRLGRLVYVYGWIKLRKEAESGKSYTIATGLPPAHTSVRQLVRQARLQSAAGGSWAFATPTTVQVNQAGQLIYEPVFFVAADPRAPANVLPESQTNFILSFTYITSKNNNV